MGFSDSKNMDIRGRERRAIDRGAGRYVRRRNQSRGDWSSYAGAIRALISRSAMAYATSPRTDAESYVHASTGGAVDKGESRAACSRLIEQCASHAFRTRFVASRRFRLLLFARSNRERSPRDARLFGGSNFFFHFARINTTRVYLARNDARLINWGAFSLR